MAASFFVVMLGLGFCTDYNQAYLGVPELYGPAEALSADIAEFRCEVPNQPKNESVLLQLSKRSGNNITWLSESTSLDGEPGSFTLLINPTHEGYLECEARVENRSNIQPAVSRAHYLKVVERAKGAEIVVLAEKVFENDKLELLCRVEAGNHLSYKWLLNGQVISQTTGLSPSRLLINRTTLAHSGSYVCEATNSFNNEVFSARSLQVEITVKGAVSAPDISYRVLKGQSNDYTAVVTCQSTTGTPPINFSLYNQMELVARLKSDSRSAAFKVPVWLDQNLGIFQCQADNGANVTHSQEISIKIVPVGGSVSLHYDYDVGENFAIVTLRLYCKATRGSHPHYHWFHNKTLMKDGRGSFYGIFHQAPKQSILVLSVGKSSAGTYHCSVSDSFDNTTAMSSKKLYLDKEVLNRLPVLAVATVFGCFTFIILLILICCVVGYWQRKPEEKPLILDGIKKTLAVDGEELNLSEYTDIDLKSVATEGCDFDQTSEESADKWQQIKPKKTLEDEAIDAL